MPDVQAYDVQFVSAELVLVQEEPQLIFTMDTGDNSRFVNFRFTIPESRRIVLDILYALQLGGDPIADQLAAQLQQLPPTSQWAARI